MGVALIIIILICLFWPVIMRYLQRFMANRAEDMVRRMAGMPSRKEEKRRRKEAQKRNASNGAASSYSRSTEEAVDGVKAMREYAEDVTFTEIKEYSSETIIGEDPTGKERRIYREEQVSDVEYVEIKVKK